MMSDGLATKTMDMTPVPVQSQSVSRLLWLAPLDVAPGVLQVHPLTA